MAAGGYGWVYMMDDGWVVRVSAGSDRPVDKHTQQGGRGTGLRVTATQVCGVLGSVCPEAEDCEPGVMGVVSVHGSLR